MDTRPKLDKPTGERGEWYNILSTISLMMLLPTLLLMIFAPAIGQAIFLTWILVVLFEGLLLTYPHIKFAFHSGKKGLLIVPLTVLISVGGHKLLDLINNEILNIRLSGGIFGTLSGTAESSLIADIFALVFLFIILGIGMPVFNFYEEYYFRKRWLYVPIWVVLHLLLGFSGFTVGALILIFIMGIIFKIVWDRWGFQSAFMSHLFTNWGSVGINLILAFL